MVKEVDCIRDYQHKMKLLVEVMVKQVDSNCQAQKLLVTDIRNKVGGGDLGSGFCMRKYLMTRKSLPTLTGSARS